ncbi:acyl carrier protein [compost metagenome]
MNLVTRYSIEEIVNIITNKVKELLQQKQIAIDEDLSYVGLDSIKSITLIVDLEESFSIVFEDDDLVFENFSSVKKISDRVITKLIFETNQQK